MQFDEAHFKSPWHKRSIKLAVVTRDAANVANTKKHDAF
ncbi:hypothetical protein BC792_107138 [Sphingobacterium allocomposti]|uniref:Uncharacterized protein n=1 Tax=Sphingobacterium allocomposti TaxID=415956 RepID=A0A5S5DNG9_9SPHI|nr:hypothetical protein BC792_107138 [Sphingobacterium composti Yoo et al. 2007 non Ten et al. 2007]